MRPLLLNPNRHDVARRIDRGLLAERVAEHRRSPAHAGHPAPERAMGPARRACRL